MERWPDPDKEPNSTLAPKQPEPGGRTRVFLPGKPSGRGKTDSREQANAAMIPPQAIPTERSRQRKDLYDARDRSPSLRISQIRALSEIGKFRLVDRADLGTFAYNGNDVLMARDIRGLRLHGLVEERTFYSAHRRPRQVLALTEDGQRAIRNAGHVPDGQQLYHGFVRPKDIDHDADLYKVYQKAVEEIHGRGGKLIRVRLDCELRSTVNRERYLASRLPKIEKQSQLKAATEQHGLRLKGGTISLPDMQIEYETAEGTMARENIELVSENYRGDSIRSKADAGFKVYVRTGDSTRVKRALQDTGAVRKILSI